VGDLGHVLARSGVGASLDAEALPMSATLASMPRALQLECTLAGGDDYELLFSAAPAASAAVRAAADRAGVAVTRIGGVEAGARPAHPRLARVCRWRKVHGLRPLPACTMTAPDIVEARVRARRRRAHAAAPDAALHAAAPGALDRAGLRQRSGALGARHGGHFVGLGRLLLLDRGSDDAQWGLVLLASLVIGLWACARTARELALADPGAIVVDEVLAFWAVLWLLMPVGFFGSARPSCCSAISMPPSPARCAGPMPCSSRREALAPGRRHPLRRRWWPRCARCW
jgi:hypothetical protein